MREPATVTAADRRQTRAAMAARFRAAGWSNRQIGRRLQVSEATIRADLRDAPAPLRPSPVPRPWAADWRPEAERLRAAGHPDHQTSQLRPYAMIADELAVSERAVRAHFTRIRKRGARAAEAARLRAAGMSNRAIAIELGISEATVRRDLGPAVVRHSPAQKLPSIPTFGPRSAHPNDAPVGAVIIPLRRSAR